MHIRWYRGIFSHNRKIMTFENTFFSVVILKHVCLRIQIQICNGFFEKKDVCTGPDYPCSQWPSRFHESPLLTWIVNNACESDILDIFPLGPISTCILTVSTQISHYFVKYCIRSGWLNYCHKIAYRALLKPPYRFSHNYAQHETTSVRSVIVFSASWKKFDHCPVPPEDGYQVISDFFDYANKVKTNSTKCEIRQVQGFCVIS